MFTGIISNIGTITASEQKGDLRIDIACDFSGALAIGDSVACNGCCLTVVEKSADHFSAELSAETLACTTSRWNKGDKINLERALKMGDSLDGHLVSGHVDGIAKLISSENSGDSHIVCLGAPQALAKFLAEKGSVTLDGVSLTVNKVESNQFWVNIIPHTWQNTTLGERKPGDRLNLEIDLIARYVERLLQK